MTVVSKITTRHNGDFGDIDATITFDVTGDIFEAEPYPWGGSRGEGREFSAELVTLQLGMLRLSRYQAEEVLGKDYVLRLEAGEAETAASEYESWSDEAYDIMAAE